MTRYVRNPKSVVPRCEALLASGHPEEAARLLTAAHRAEPDNPAILALNGRALTLLGRHEAAVGALTMALGLEPGSAAAHARLTGPLVAAGNLQGALMHAAEAFRLQPDAKHATAVAGVLWNLCRHEETLHFADTALALEPDQPSALINRALALEGLGRFEEAVAAGAHAVATAPDNAIARFHQAIRLLRAGQMTAEAWDLYEARITLNGYKPSRHLTLWEGEDIAGKTILLHAEQGLGDTLHFVRYAPLVQASGARVVLAVQPPLMRLLQGSPGVDVLVESGVDPPRFDVAAALLSLPRLFGTTAETIPPPVPYAHRWAAWTDEAPGLRVGLVWAGNTGFVHDRHRSIAPSDLAPLAGVPGVRFYSLQHGAFPADLPPDLGAADLMPGVQDFLDTAGRIAGLDLVIAVDTAVAHLAATMGKPVWLLSRFLGCWRWLERGDTTAWYPTMRIFRQERPGDWARVLHEVRAELTALAAQR